MDKVVADEVSFFDKELIKEYKSLKGTNLYKKIEDVSILLKSDVFLGDKNINKTIPLSIREKYGITHDLYVVDLGTDYKLFYTITKETRVYIIITLLDWVHIEDYEDYFDYKSWKHVFSNDPEKPRGIILKENILTFIEIFIAIPAVLGGFSFISDFKIDSKEISIYSFIGLFLVTTIIYCIVKQNEVIPYLKNKIKLLWENL